MWRFLRALLLAPRYKAGWREQYYRSLRTPWPRKKAVLREGRGGPVISHQSSRSRGSDETTETPASASGPSGRPSVITRKEQ